MWPWPSRIPLSVRGFRALRAARAGDFAIRFRTAIAVELPDVAHVFDLVEIQVGHEQFIFVPAGLRHDFPTWIAEIALSVELADLPRSFRAHAVDGCHEVRVRDGMRGLLEFPEILGKPRYGGRRVVHDFRAVQPQDARAFGKVPVVADVHAHAAVARLKHRISRVAGREVKLLPKTRMAMRNVVLAVFSEVASVGINHGRGVEIDAGHFHFVHRNHQHHAVTPRQTLHALDRRPFGNALGEFVPARLLLGAEIRTVEKFLQAENLHLALGGVANQTLVLGDHLFLDLSQRELFRRPFTARLNQATTDYTRHRAPPGKRWRKFTPRQNALQGRAYVLGISMDLRP